MEQGHGTYSMATLVFWHVPLRFCNGEALTNPRAKQAQTILKALICMANLSIDVDLLQGARSLKYHVPLAIPLIFPPPPP